MTYRSLSTALVVAALAAAPAAAKVKAGDYSGETDQERTVTFTVKKGKVVDFTAGVMTWCSTMGAQRSMSDAVANVPAMKIKKNGRFAYEGDVESDGTITMAVSGRIKGKGAKGKITLTRPDSNYENGQFTFGQCSAHDRAWSAKRK